MTKALEQPSDQPISITDLQPKMCLQGVVKQTQLYGAVVDIGVERNGLVHISQLSTDRVNRVTDVVEAGDSVTVWVTKVNAEQGRIGLTMIEPPEVDWHELEEGQVHTGTVTRLEPYGAFVDIGAPRPGLLHVREMSSVYVRHPSELVHVGEEVEVRVLKFDRRKRRIDLTMVNIEAEVDESELEEAETPQTSMEIALQQARKNRRQKSKRRHGKRRRPNLAEQEDILARTLKQHSKR